MRLVGLRHSGTGFGVMMGKTLFGVWSSRQICADATRRKVWIPTDDKFAMVATTTENAAHNNKIWQTWRIE